MKRLLFILLLCFMVLIPQEETEDKAKNTVEDQNTPSGIAEVSEPLPGEFVYNPMGRRDPFWDLLQRNSTKLKEKRKEGLEGLDIDQLELEGIIKKNGEFVALLKGPDGRPYMVQKGNSVYDGEIIEIGSQMVKFRKVLTIALGGTKERTIIKRLNPEQEDEKENEN